MSTLALEQCQDEPSSSLIDLNDFEFERRKIDLAVPWLRQSPESAWRHEKSWGQWLFVQVRCWDPFCSELDLRHCEKRFFSRRSIWNVGTSLVEQISHNLCHILILSTWSWRCNILQDLSRFPGASVPSRCSETLLAGPTHFRNLLEIFDPQPSTAPKSIENPGKNCQRAPSHNYLTTFTFYYIYLYSISLDTILYYFILSVSYLYYTYLNLYLSTAIYQTQEQRSMGTGHDICSDLKQTNGRGRKFGGMFEVDVWYFLIFDWCFEVVFVRTFFRLWHWENSKGTASDGNKVWHFRRTATGNSGLEDP